MTDQENNNSISSNPFAALFGSIADAKHFAAVQKQQLRQPRGGGAPGRARPAEPRAASPAGALRSSRFAGDETSVSQDDSDNSVSESLDDCDYSVAEISRSFRSQRELCEQLNINHMIQRIFLITLDNSEAAWEPAFFSRGGGAGGSTGWGSSLALGRARLIPPKSEG